MKLLSSGSSRRRCGLLLRPVREVSWRLPVGGSCHGEAFKCQYELKEETHLRQVSSQPAAVLLVF